MGPTRCLISTRPTQELASQLGISPERGVLIAGIWQTRNNNSELPSVEEARQLLNTLVEQKKWEEEVQKYFEMLPPVKAADFQASVDYDYTTFGRQGLVSTTALEAIRRGERTASTRFTKIDDKWSKLKVGDTVEFKDKQGDRVIVRVTKPLTKITVNTDAEEWSKKEGFNTEYFEKNVRFNQNAWQFEFEYVGDIITLAKDRVASYIGDIEPEKDTIFVFGSNPEGRHGSGAAKVAVEKFGAKIGVGEGMTGDAYALPTKDLRVKENNSLRSISPEAITESIKKLYAEARRNPNLKFKVAYRNGENETTLNGYTGGEMIDMFVAAGPIPSNIIFSKEWASSERFNNATIASVNMSKTYQQEEVIWTPTIPDINIEAVEENQVRLARAFTPQQLFKRIKNVSYHFSDAIDILYDKKIKELRQQVEKYKQGSLENQQAVWQLNDILDSKKGKDNFIHKYLNITEAVKEAKKSLEDRYSRWQKIPITDSNREVIEYQLDQFKRMVDNFDLLLIQALSDIEANEDIRITISQAETVTSKKALIGENVADTEDLEADDLNERVVSGNSGWVFSARKADPRRSITQNVRRILRQIPVTGDNALDDLGYQQFMDFEFTYATILNGCSDMIDSSDFDAYKRDINGNVVQNAKGNPIRTLPALEKLASKYEWLEGVIQHLKSNPNLIPEFYSCFRLDYIPYYMLSNGRMAKANSEMSTANAIDSITRNYEQGNTIHKDSIFTTSGNINYSAATKGSELADKLLQDLNNEDFDASDYDSLNTLLKMLGVYVDGNLKKFLDLDNVPEDVREINKASLYKVLNRIKAICDRISELQPNDHLITHFNSEYSDISKIVGSVTMFNRHMTFRQGENDYPSYSTPNYVTTLFKKLLSTDETRREEIFNFFKSSEWYFAKGRGTWRNFMLDELQHNTALVEELREGALLNINTIRESGDIFNNKSKTIEYKDWTPDQIKQLFITAYFTGGTSESSSQQYGYYHFPIFADTECAMMFKFLRFTDNYEEQIIPLLREVVYQELYRRKLVADRKAKGASEIANFDKNGDKFFFFHELNSYKVEIDDAFIRSFYNHKLKTANDAEKQAINNKLRALPAARNGKTFADFNDIISAYSILGNKEAIDNTIDSALRDIMNQQFTSFYNNLGDNIPLLQMLVNENIIPENELEEAVERKKDRTRKEKKTALKNSVSHKFEEGKKEEKPKTAKYDSLEAALREFYWNDTLMQTQIIELTTVDPAFYKFDGGIDFQKRYKEVYASGRKLDTNSKYGRELQKTIYLKDRYTVSRIYNDIKSLFETAVKSGRMSEQDKNSILEAFEKINNADAQAYRVPSSMRAVLDMAGMWTDEMEAAYNSIMSEEWDPANFSVIWQTLKPFTFALVGKDDGTDSGNTMYVPHQNKDSEFLILAAYSMFAAATKNNAKLKALNSFMESNGFDVAVYESGVKTGNQNPIDLNIGILIDKDGTVRFNVLNDIEDTLWDKIEASAKSVLGNKYKAGRNKENFYAGSLEMLKSGQLSQEEYNSLQDFVEPTEQQLLEILNAACFKKNDEGATVENYDTIHLIPYADYMIATPTPEHWIDSKVVDGSQKRNLLISDLEDDDVIVINGKEYKVGTIRPLYDNLHLENLLDDFVDIRKEISDVPSLQRFLLSQIKDNPKYSRDFQNILDLINGGTDFAVPLEFPSVKNKLIELVLSKFKNGITKQKAKGGSCILVADNTNTLNIVLEDGTYLNTKDKTALENAKKHNLIKGFECFLPAWARDFYTDFIVTKRDGNKVWEELDIEKLKEECPELLEMSGIRIPTEDKYSMTPLIVKGFLPSESGSAIMLPAEITTIVGADFDVDKMFIRVYHYTKDENGKYKKVEYDYNSTPEQQSRQARENALLDIELGILRSKAASEALFNPGNFDPIKKQGRIAQILSEVTDSGDSLLALWQEQHGIDYNDVDSALVSLQRASVDEVKDFIDKFSKKRSIMSLDTFVYNHQQNMVGAALIGMYANNTTGQAKMQTTRLAIKDKFTFTLEGKDTVNGVRNRRLIKSLHDIYSTNKYGVRERISKRCAYFSAASVDNVKDPALARIRQNTKTANIAGFMLRAGLDVEEISLLFCQPFIAWTIDSTGQAPTGKMIEGQLKYYNEKFGTSFSLDKLRAKVSSYSYNTNELAKNIVQLNRYARLLKEDKDKVSQEEKSAMVEKAMMAILLFERLDYLSNQFRGSIQISRADSPNGAIANTLEKANLQVRRIDEYMSNVGNDAFGIENITDIMQNRIANAWYNKKVLRKKLKAEGIKVHRLQAFYTLGIELAQQLVGKYFISQSPACQAIVKKIEANLGSGKRLDEAGLKTLYNDFTTYLLSKTRRFGDEEGQTFEQKRDYYLYQYPQQFDKIRRENPDIAKIAGVNLLRIVEGQIVLDRSGKITPAVRDSIMTGFDTLIGSNNEVARKLAIDLFMYSYYNEGLIFRHNSYGQFFSAFFLRRFPDVLDALRGIPDANVMSNFFEQWCSQKDNLDYFTEIRKASKNSDTSIKVEAADVKYNSSYLLPGDKKNTPYNYVTFGNELYAFSHLTEGNAAIYKKVGMIDAGPTENKLHKFNANVTADQLAQIEVDQDRVENLKLLNTTSFRTVQREASKNPVNAMEANMFDDASGMPDESILNSMESSVDTSLDGIDLDNLGNEFGGIDVNDFDDTQYSGWNALDEFDSSLDGIPDYDEEDGQQTLLANNEDIMCPPNGVE